MLECPKCSYVPPNPLVRFCPNCGARRLMEGEVQRPGKQIGTGKSSGKVSKLTIALIGVVGFSVLYVLTYLCMSLGGHAEQEITGTFRDSSGSPVVDLEHWQPAGIAVTRYREVNGQLTTKANTAGWFFLPMVLADRHWWHQSKSLRTPQSTTPSPAGSTP